MRLISCVKSFSDARSRRAPRRAPAAPGGYQTRKFRTQHMNNLTRTVMIAKALFLAETF